MKLLLVDPPFHAFLGYDRWWFSYACAHLAAVCRAHGIEAWVYDADRYFPADPATQSREEMVRRQPLYREGVDDTEHAIWRHFRATLEDLRPDCVGVASWTCKQRSVLTALRLVKSVLPRARTCVGGYHATARPQDFAHHPDVDAVFTGPADATLPGWVLRGSGRGVVAADPAARSTESLPRPAREALLFPGRYRPADMGMLMTSRGCPYDCAFCSNRLMTGGRVVQRPAADVRAEVADLAATYRIRAVTVADADFLCMPRRAVELGRVFQANSLPWGCEGRLDAVTGDLLDRLQETGMETLCFGIETGTDDGLRRLRKGLTTDTVRRAAELLNARRIDWKGFFIAGFPFDTLETLEETRRFALGLGASVLSLNAFTPLPGTDLYDEWRTAIEAAPCELWDFNQLNPAASLMPGVPTEAYRIQFAGMLRDFDAYNRQRRALGAFHG